MAAKGILLLAALLHAAPAVAETVEMRFAAYGGGLSLAEGTLLLSVDRSGPLPRYDARLSAGGSSLVAFFTNFSYRAEAVGTVRPSALTAEQFRGERRLRRKHEVIALRFSPKETVVQAQPPIAPDKAALVPPAARRGTVDPLSAGAGVIASAGLDGGGGPACTATYPVYDGRRRYDLAMRPLGPARLEPSRYGVAAGPATACTVTLRPVAGFERDRDPGAFFAHGVERTATLWFARVQPQDLVLPVKVQVETSFGSVLVHAVAVERKG